MCTPGINARPFHLRTFSHNLVDKGNRKIVETYSFSLTEGQTAAFEKHSVTATDMYFDSAKLLDTAVGIVNESVEKGSDALFQESAAWWNERWNDCDVTIEAQDSEGYNSQLSIRIAMYHMLRAKAPDETRGSICSKTLTSDGYFGSVFWAMEMFKQPFFMYTAPEYAKSHIVWRYKNLEEARKIAKSYGYKGARYPWQSSFNGEEVCAAFQYADHQVHVTADVIVSMWHYYKATGDMDLLLDCGTEMAIETARYWTGRVDYIKGREGYQLYGVMGPDEYKPITNNNYYTNFMVKRNLALACELPMMMKEMKPEAYKKLCKKIGFDESETAEFKKIGEGLTLLEDKERNLLWQCDDFETAFADVDIEGLWEDKNVLFGWYLSQEKRYRSKAIKQADIIALMGIYTETFTKEQMEACYRYYAPITIHDSSLSYSHHAIVISRLGIEDELYDWWKKAIDVDFGVLPRASDGIHSSNAGAMWQIIVNAFAGMVNALNTDILWFKPCVPDNMEKISFKVLWKKSPVEVTVTKHEFTLKNLSDSEIEFKLYDKEYKAEKSAIVKLYY